MPCVPVLILVNKPVPGVVDEPKRVLHPDCWPGCAAEEAKSPPVAAGCCGVAVLPNSPPPVAGCI
jgi:hypothetical protein